MLPYWVADDVNIWPQWSLVHPGKITPNVEHI